MLERGVAPWQKPWEPGAGSLGIPFNPTSERAYRGGNAIHLMATSLQRGYEDPKFQCRGTFPQVILHSPPRQERRALATCIFRKKLTCRFPRDTAASKTKYRMAARTETSGRQALYPAV
jgi:hypothetical protein